MRITTYPAGACSTLVTASLKAAKETCGSDVQWSFPNGVRRRYLKMWVEGALSRKAGAEAFWIMLGQGLALGGSLVGVRMLTGVLSPAEYGELALAMTVVTLSGQCVMGPLGNGVSRYYSASWERGEASAFMGAVWRLSGMAGLVVAGAGASIVAALALSGRGHLLHIALPACVFALAAGANAVLDGLQIAARQRVVVAWHAVAGSWGRFGLAVAFVAACRGGAAVAIAGYAAAATMVLASQLAFVARSFGGPSLPPHASADIWRSRILTYSWPFAVWGVFGWAQVASDRWALQSFAPPSTVGLYAALYQVGYYPVSLAVNVIVQLVAPILFQRAGDSSDIARMLDVHRAGRRLTAVALVLAVVAVVLSWGLKDVLMRLLLAPEYRDAASLLPGVVAAGGLFAAGQMAQLPLMSSAATSTLLLPKIGTATFGVVANVIGAKMAGLAGVVGALLVTSIVYLAWCVVVARAAVSESVAAEARGGICR